MEKKQSYIKNICFRLDSGFHSQLKAHLALKEISLQKWLEALITQEFNKEKKS